MFLVNATAVFFHIDSKGRHRAAFLHLRPRINHTLYLTCVGAAHFKQKNPLSGGLFVSHIAQGGTSSIDKMKFTRTCSVYLLDNSYLDKSPMRGWKVKKMPDKDPNLAGLSWLILLGVACWGGLVRYLTDIKQSRASWSWAAAVAQMVVSGFCGILSGFLSMAGGLDIYYMLFAAGICGTMGSVALTYFWERFTGVRMQ